MDQNLKKQWQKNNKGLDHDLVLKVPGSEVTCYIENRMGYVKWMIKKHTQILKSGCSDSIEDAKNDCNDWLPSFI